MLEINNLHCKIEGKSILKGINLKVNKGEIHAVMVMASDLPARVNP